MNRAFIQCDKELNPINPNIYNAFYGLRDMGFEIIKFNSLEDLSNYCHDKGEIIVGGIEIIRERLRFFNIIPPTIDYPNELTGYLGREIKECKLSYIINNPNLWPIFIKSKEQKKISGKLIQETKNIVGIGFQNEDPEVYYSEAIDFISEYRVFVRYGEILDCKHYYGNPLIFPDYRIIQSAIKDYINSPNAYGIDFGITKENKTLLIEVNDGWALGSYGLESHLYSKFLLTRWAQITNTIDEYYYI